MTSPIIQFKRGDYSNLPALQAGEPALTLDTFEFYIGINSTTEENKFFGSHRYWTRETASKGSGVNLVESTGVGTDFITLASPSSLSGIVTYTFPESPEDGYFLQTDADGNLSWTSVTAGAAFFGASLENTTLSGISTFSGAIDANDGADIEGQTELDDVNVSAAATFSGTDDNTLGDPDTGAVQIDGGLGVNKNVTIGANLYVEGYSEFVGVATFKGGTINLGDANTDNVNVAGEFVSNLVPNNDDTYDLGTSSQKWRNQYLSGQLSTPTINTGTINAEDETSAITIADVTGNVGVSSNLTIGGNLFVNGSTTQVNTTTLTVEDSLIEVGTVDGSAPSSDLNKDLGLLLNYYTDSAKKAAVYWDDSASRIAIASEVSESNSVLTANAYAALEIGSLWVNDCAGQSQVIDCSNGVRTLQNVTIDAGTF